MDPSDPDWKVFEKDVANLTAQLKSSPAQIQWNAKIPGVSSSVLRQVDVFVRGDLHGIPIAIAIECKKYGRKIDVGEMDAFIGKLSDLAVDKGVFYVHDGVTPGARNRAAAALHPKIMLKELNGTHLVGAGWDDLIDLDCPNENCWSGSVRWGVHKQPAGGADVEGGPCDMCGTTAIRCRDCGEIDSIEVGDHSCFCGAQYEISSDHYQSTDVDLIIQTSRGND